MKNPRIPLAGVVGWPIAHSKSPILHGHWLKTYEIAGQYVPIGLPPEDFESGLKALALLGFNGVNVTIPHKEKALELATQVSDRAKAIGAANTLTFLPEGGYLADNTDGIGFLNNLKQNAPAWKNAGPALILGAGGAARAVVSALLEDGCPKIYLSNRTSSRAQDLAVHFGPKVQVIGWETINDSVEFANTIVNTTSLGMSGQPPLTISLEAAKPDTLVTDIVYTPLLTPLLEDAQNRDLQVVDGLGMLLHQAAIGFEVWFGQKPKVDDALRKAVLKG